MFAQENTADVEDDLDALFLDNAEQNSTESSAVEKPAFNFFGYIESENAFGISGSSSMKNKNIIKTEMKARLQIRYGTSFFYAKGVFDIFFYPTSLSPVYQNNYQGKNTAYFNPYEFYIGGGKSFQFRIGKILYNWGNSDFYSLTNYFDQKDMRELMFKEEDERYAGGTFSLHLKYLFKSYAVEAVVATQNNYPLLPLANSFWQFDFQRNLPVKMDYSQTSSPFFEFPSYKDISAAFRIGGSAGAVDFHFSYFNGYSDAIIFVEDRSDPTYVSLKTFRDRVNKIGFDMAWVYKKLSGRFELLAIPDYVTAYSDASRTDPSNANIRGVGRVPYLAFTAGADFLFHGDYGRILIEYSQGFFLRNPKEYEKGMLSQFFLIALQERVYKDHIGLFFALIGLTPKIQLDYDFKNGLTIAAGTLIFFDVNQYLLKMYRNHDLFYLRAHYEF